MLTAKEYLAQIPPMREHVCRLESKIRRYKEIATSPSAPSLEPHYNPNPNTASPFEKPLLEIEELEKELRDARKVYDYIAYEAKYILCQLDDDNERLTLQHLYLEGMSYSNTARKLNKSVKTIRRYEESALAQIKMPENYMEVYSDDA